MIALTNYYKYIERLKTKSYEELVQMRDELINDIYEIEANERAGLSRSTNDALYSEYNKQLSLVIDELNIKYDKIQSGFSDEELYADSEQESICPRCKFPSKKYRYCPKCNFLKLLSTYDGLDMYDFEKGEKTGDTFVLDEDDNNTEDQLFSDAVMFSIEKGKVNVSMIQKKFEVGYSRAARLLDKMEAKGYIEAPNNTKFRKVLISKKEFLDKK